MDVSRDEDADKLLYTQRLKAAVHYTVGKICEDEAADLDVTFSRQFIAVLAEATFKQCQVMAKDLEQFAKHAKRTTINADDVKLLIRKSPALLDHINSMHESEVSRKEQKTKRTKKRKPTIAESTTEHTNLDIAEESNDT
eukprot:GHVT01066908.1.p1 GENE.GHVT01066908.1~~GHVT01066908.1.p1  ORF type:complete len:140 (-),score=15.65 GHVT01066908.1:393-812(-)